MPINGAIHTRFDSLDTAARLTSAGVVALADFIERLIVLERTQLVIHASEQFSPLPDFSGI